MKHSQRVLLGGVSLLLVFSIGLVTFFGAKKAERTMRTSVRGLLPDIEEMPGWSIDYRPVADTPELQARVNELLNYDDAVFAVYTKTGTRISVYIAYWEPGKMPVKEIARHTPDVCWVANGWTPTAQEGRELSLGSGDGQLYTEYRIFTGGGHVEHVVFWHIVGGEVHSYGTRGRPPWYAAIADTLRWGAKQRPEQLFVRISSDRPLEEFWSAQIGQSVLRSIPGLATTRT